MNFFGDIDLKGNKLINVGPTNATIESGLGSGGSDPLLEARVEKLENQAATILKSFTDDFSTNSFINNAESSNVTRVIDGSDTYVQINPSVVSVNNPQSEADSENSINVAYNGSGHVSNTALNVGEYYSEYLPINSATVAKITASYTTPIVNTFSDETIITNAAVPNDVYNFTTIADSTRRWFFYQTLSGYGEIYGWSVDLSNGADTSPIMSHRRIGTLGPAGNITLNANPFRTLSASMDNNGNVFLAAWRFIGGTTAAFNRCAVYRILKSNPATDNFVDESRQLIQTTATSIRSLDTIFDSVNNRFHVAYNVPLANNNGGFFFYDNGATMSFISQRAFPVIATDSSTFNIKLVRSTTASQEFAMFYSPGSATQGIRAFRYSINVSNYGIPGTPVNFTSNSNGTFHVLFDSTNGFIITTISSAGTQAIRAIVPTSFSLASNYTAVASTVSAGATISSGAAVSDGTHLYFSYLVNEGTFTLPR